MSTFNFESNPEIQIASFGLTEGFIENLSPEDLRGVINAIAKYAAISRHPDKFGSNDVDYSFGNTDARTLTSIAGKLSLLSNDELSELQDGYSEDAIVKQQAQHVMNLAKMVDDRDSELRAVKSLGFELLLPRNYEDTIDGFTGDLICRPALLAKSSNLLIASIENGGFVKEVNVVKPLGKEFLRDAESWVGEAYKLAQETKGEEYPEVLIASTAEGSELRTASGGSTIDLTENSIEVPTPQMSRKSKLPQLYLIANSMNKRTGAHDKPVLITYARNITQRLALPGNSRVLGFAHNTINESDDDKFLDSPLGLRAITSPESQKIDEMRLGASRVNINTFWRKVIGDKRLYSRSLGSSDDFAPMIYDQTRPDEFMMLGQYRLALRNK